MTTRSLAHLLGRLGVIEERIRLLVATRRTTDPAPDDPFRGLYLSDEVVDRLLATPRSHVRLAADGRPARVMRASGRRRGGVGRRAAAA